MLGPRPFTALVTLATVALSGCATLARRSPTQNYEIWALDQGTNVVHIFDSTFRETATVDLGSQGARVLHFIDFTSDYRYAFIANPASGNVAVIRAADRKLVTLIPTGPRTHHAAVAPDDRTVLVAVIGAANAPWDGKVVEVLVDAARERFTVGRQLMLADDPLFAVRKAEFKETGGAACLAFTENGRYAYVSLGPALDEGGVVVLGGDRDVGVWHSADSRTHAIVHRADSRGHDAHGSAITPDGREYWLVNRVTSNAVVFDTKTRAVLAEIPFVGKTPDVVAISPDSRYAFITLRGPNPVTMPHLAIGETPGFAVIDIRTRRQLRLIEPAKGNAKSDFHGIAVRLLR